MTSPVTTASERQPQADKPESRFAAFENRNFRLYFIGQTISNIGSWLQTLAITWLVLEITNRSDRLGITMALQFLPMLILGAPAGVLADKINNSRLLITTSALSGLIAATLGVIVATGHAGLPSIYALTLLLGIVLAVERPTMQSILFELVGPKLLPKAVATNSSINPMSRLVGPALAGVLIATVGIKACFYLNAVSYLVVIAALLALRSNELVARPHLGRTKGKLREGFAYVRTNPDVARPLLVMVIVGTVAYNFPTTLPSIVRFGFHRGAGSAGTLMSVSAIGSILGGIYIAGIKPHPRRTHDAPSPLRSPDSRSPCSCSRSSPDIGRSSPSASPWASRPRPFNRSTPQSSSRPPNLRCKGESWPCIRWRCSAAHP